MLDRWARTDAHFVKDSSDTNTMPCYGGWAVKQFLITPCDNAGPPNPQGRAEQAGTVPGPARACPRNELDVHIRLQCRNNDSGAFPAWRNLCGLRLEICSGINSQTEISSLIAETSERR
jgi:hypothetical protein